MCRSENVLKHIILGIANGCGSEKAFFLRDTQELPENQISLTKYVQVVIQRYVK